MMKLKKILPIAFLIFCVALSSCSKDDNGTIVKLRFISSNPNVPVSVSTSFGTHLKIAGSWENVYLSKNEEVYILAQSDDDTVLLTVEIYVNGMLRSKVFKNSKAYATVKI